MDTQKPEPDPWGKASTMFQSESPPSSQATGEGDNTVSSSLHASSFPSTPSGPAKVAKGILKKSNIADKQKETFGRLNAWVSVGAADKKEQDRKAASSMLLAKNQSALAKVAPQMESGVIMIRPDALPLRAMETSEGSKEKVGLAAVAAPKPIFSRSVGRKTNLGGARKSAPKVPFNMDDEANIPVAVPVEDVPNKPLRNAPRKSTPNPKSSKPSVSRKRPPTKKAAAPAKSSKRADTAPLVREGRPTESIEGGWPEGWIRRDFQRLGGETVGRVDKYWYPPGHEHHRLRSMKEVERYMAALKDSPGDYDFAWLQRKG